MPIYHVIIGLKSRPREWIIKDNILERELLRGIVEPYNRGEDFRCDDVVVNREDISNIKITESEKAFMGPLYRPSPQRHFADRWQAINQMKDVTDKFIKTLLQGKKEKNKKTTTISKNVFIVHGRDHKPMKELKTMLYEFGLNPIVLHEKASGGLTLAEKLEKYSEDVRYAFVILTPEDVGCEKTKVEKLKSELEAPFLKRPILVSAGYIEGLFKRFRPRARQNVIFEMGYFWGLLKRKNVCCLLKGDVEKPSDIEGIVYIPFKGSIDEVQVKIIKELTEAGYEIKL